MKSEKLILNDVLHQMTVFKKYGTIRFEPIGELEITLKNGQKLQSTRENLKKYFPEIFKNETNKYK